MISETRALRSRRVLWTAAAVVPVIWLPLILLWADAPFAMTFDDAWYYFEIGRNVAEGQGSTFDTIEPTNGYHPLWLGITSLGYLVGLDDLTAVRALLVLQLAGWTLTLLVIGDVVARAIAGFPRIDGTRTDAEMARRLALLTVAAVLVVFAANPFVLKVFVNGLESGPATLIHAVLLAMVWRSGGRIADGTSPWRRALTGGLLALAFLARTDALLLIGCVGLWSLAEVRSLGRLALRRLVEVFTLPAVTMAAYFGVNAAVFADPRQVSGEIKRLDLTPERVLLLAVFAGIALVMGLRAFRACHRPTRRTSRLPRSADVAATSGWYVAFAVLLVGYYTVLSAQQWLWYFAPVVLLLLVLLLMVTADLAEGVVAEAPAARSSWRALVPIQVILVGTLLAGLAWQVVSFSDPDKRSILLANREAGEWMSANLPDDAVIASWDAGVLGYFTEQPVVNLDGVVNSYEWVEARESGTTAAFLEARDVGWVANHGGLVGGEDPDIRDQVRALFGADAAQGLHQDHRVEFTYTGGIEGEGTSGTREMAVFVHRLPAADT